jgi:hypothetical protein
LEGARLILVERHFQHQIMRDALPGSELQGRPNMLWSFVVQCFVS